MADEPADPAADAPTDAEVDGEVRVGVDVGGTFTDVIAADGRGVGVAKVPSTPDDQAAGVLEGVERAGVSPAAVRRFVHGTTVATNTLLERDGARTVLVTTAGFRDLLTIGRQDRPALYDLAAGRPDPLVPRERVVEVDERLGPDGVVVTPLTETEVDRAAGAVAALRPEAVAISLLFAFTDDRHERRLQATVAAHLGPGVPVSRSSALLPVFREYERTATTAVNAYVGPRMRRYLTSLRSRLADGGLAGPVEVMRSGGGTFTAAAAAEEPVHTLLSGPAAGAWGAAAVGRAAGLRDCIALDMGGTSTDVSLVTDGRPRTTAEGQIGGLPFAVSTTDVHTIGAGGGSVAWIDDGGALRVGPRSAGADPGPACYGRGGREPTVTDANLVLGRLDAGVALGGSLPLRPDRARAALGRLGERLGMGPVEAAAGVVRIVEAQMAEAVRVVSVERGEDPRRFALVALGGAGPLHQAALARRLSIGTVLVPPRAGVLSALGLLAAPVTAERVRTNLVPADDADAERLSAGLDRLEDAARASFRERGAPVASVSRRADLRYLGQAFELTVTADGGGADGPGRVDVAALVERFHAAHEDRYGYAQPGEPTEIVNLRVRLEGPQPSLPATRPDAGDGAAAAVVRHTTVVVDGTARECPVSERRRLGVGDTIDGPAVVTDTDTTCFVADWQRATVDGPGNLVIRGAP